MKARGTVNFRLGRRLPIYIQDEVAECALACLAMIADYHGFEIDLRQLRKCFGSSARGVTLADVLSAARSIKLQGRGVRIEMDGLRHLTTPCILHWDRNHFVVLKEIKGDRLVVHDPATGVVEMGFSEASKHFTGVALELSPAPDFRQARFKESVTLRQLTGRVVGWRQAAGTVLLLAGGLELLLILTPLLIQLVVDGALGSEDFSLLTIIAVGLAVSFILQALISVARSWTTLFLSMRLKTQWYGNVFGHMLKLPLSYFEQRFIGSIASRFDSISTIQRTISGNFVETVLDGFAALLMLVAMFFYSRVLGSIVVLSVLLYLAVKSANYRRLEQATQVYLARFGKQQTLLLETLRGIRPLRLFKREDQQEMRWQAILMDATNSQLDCEKISTLVRSSNVLIFGLETAAIVWLGGNKVISGSLTIGMFVAFLAFKEQFNVRIAALIDRLFDLRLLSAQLDRLADIVLTEPARSTDSDSRQGLTTGAVVIEDLWFRHSETSPWIIKNLDLSVYPGECVAIVGPSGIGKSTLIKIVATLLDPSRGEVRIGRENDPSGETRKAPISFVMQDDTLFAGSLLENISFFDGCPSIDRVVECAQIACIHEEITRMPMGYETLIGDMGGALSGGQRQRILLARALYCNPGILVLDEATSHLDASTEAQIAAALSRLKVTRIIVAHRVETVRIADRVFAFHDGHLELQHGIPVADHAHA